MSFESSSNAFRFALVRYNIEWREQNGLDKTPIKLNYFLNVRIIIFVCFNK